MYVMEYYGGEGVYYGVEYGVEFVGYIEVVMYVMLFEMGFIIFGLFELGMMLGFLVLFIYVILNQLFKVLLILKNDFYFEEFLYYYVELYGEEVY